MAEAPEDRNLVADPDVEVLLDPTAALTEPEMRDGCLLNYGRPSRRKKKDRRAKRCFVATSKLVKNQSSPQM